MARAPPTSGRSVELPSSLSSAARSVPPAGSPTPPTPTPGAFFGQPRLTTPAWEPARSRKVGPPEVRPGPAGAHKARAPAAARVRRRLPGG